ncbi:MAG: homocysteine S-methyltransferase family protein [Clostridia bacterium]|nr:homocysteine S-methyltransferase family protein [Clostridia bacterium]
MNILEYAKDHLVYLDGGTGTVLQSLGLQPGELPELWNLRHPDRIVSLHRVYFENGSNLVLTNTFGANRLKYTGLDGMPTVAQVVEAAVHCAQEGRKAAPNPDNVPRFVALDIGPLGRILEPLGDLPFEEAVSIFSETVRAGAAAGADLVFIETMNDCYETKAAVLAAKENCSLPIFVSNTYDETSKLMTGATPEAMVAMLEGLGVDALGANCSLGPKQMVPVIRRLVACSSLPVLVKPNAGMPRSVNGETVFDVGAEEFSDIMTDMVAAGARFVGGCCGTNPEFIRLLCQKTANMEPLPVTEKHRSVISSYSDCVVFGDSPVVIGERINPTGRKRLKQALLENNLDYLLREGLSQQEQGAHVLDVNVGLPGLDEAALLQQAATSLQSVCTLPLQLDSSDPAALERAMRCYNGKPLVNSVNGKKESMEAVFPLVKRYGGLVVCLTLDENGIPNTAEGRFVIAEKILKTAVSYGVSPDDLIFDPLAMAVSAEPSAAKVALQAVRLIRTQLNCRTVLGVSNISFGLPARTALTASFLTMALTEGLSAAIVNPGSPEIQKALRAYNALMGYDENCSDYIGFSTALADAAPSAEVPAEKSVSDLTEAIVHGLASQATIAASAALETASPLDVVNGQIIPALDIVGKGFERKTVYLPQLLMAAEAAKAAFDKVKERLPADNAHGPAIVLATVKGDIHDIGKNIVKVLLQNYGFSVVDLGRDVSAEMILEAARQHGSPLVGLSALMTTTVPAMEETIALLHEQLPSCRIAVGGAVLTQEYADRIGADCYCATAMDTVRYAESIIRR